MCDNVWFVILWWIFSVIWCLFTLVVRVEDSSLVRPVQNLMGSNLTCRQQYYTNNGMKFTCVMTNTWRREWNQLSNRLASSITRIIFQKMNNPQHIRLQTDSFLRVIGAVLKRYSERAAVRKLIAVWHKKYVNFAGIHFRLSKLFLSYILILDEWFLWNMIWQICYLY